MKNLFEGGMFLDCSSANGHFLSFHAISRLLGSPSTILTFVVEKLAFPWTKHRCRTYTNKVLILEAITFFIHKVFRSKIRLKRDSQCKIYFKLTRSIF